MDPSSRNQALEFAGLKQQPRLTHHAYRGCCFNFAYDLDLFKFKDISRSTHTDNSLIKFWKNA